MDNKFDSKSFLLILMNLPHISRKTINFILNNSLIHSIEDNCIIEMFRQAHMKNKRIKIPTLSEVNLAKEKAKSVLSQTNYNDIGIITILDSDFPNKLRIIPDPPVIIFYKGNKECLYEDKSVAIIGTRNPTEHGIKIANRLGYIFGECGFTVVSGLAKGCDENGHRGCLDAQGNTIAVLPCGLDNVYPASNKKLAEEILKKGGCLLSEYQVGTRPFKNYFVERDRLQSALSECVIVVETDVVGGTMHTVKYSKEQSKILACYKHDIKYEKDKQTQGNKILIESNQAIALDSPSSIDNLKQIIFEKISKRINEDNEVVNSKNITQLKFL